MTTHYGSPLTAFLARTSCGAQVGSNAPWLWPLTVMKFPWPPVMLATLNFATTGDRARTCPMCTYQDPCFLCSDDLKWWLEDSNLQARRSMGIHPMPLSQALCICESTGQWCSTDGVVGASAELFDTSDVHELLAFYGQRDRVHRQAKGGFSKQDEDITVNAYPSSETDPSSSLENDLQTA